MPSLALFTFVNIHELIHFYFMYFFLCHSIITVTLGKGWVKLQSIDHNESSAWALRMPQVCRGMWSFVRVTVCVCKCLCTIFSSLQAQTAQVKKHNCSHLKVWGTSLTCLSAVGVNIWCTSLSIDLCFALMCYRFLHMMVIQAQTRCSVLQQ